MKEADVSVKMPLNKQSVTIDDASAARVHKLLTIVTVVSNFPLMIVGLGVILLLVFIILLVRDRRQKVRRRFLPRSNLNNSQFGLLLLICN